MKKINISIEGRKPRCFGCGEIGQIKWDCSRREKEEEEKEQQEEEGVKEKKKGEKRRGKNGNLGAQKRKTVPAARNEKNEKKTG